MQVSRSDQKIHIKNVDISIEDTTLPTDNQHIYRGPAGNIYYGTQQGLEACQAKEDHRNMLGGCNPVCNRVHQVLCCTYANAGTKNHKKN